MYLQTSASIKRNAEECYPVVSVMLILILIYLLIAIVLTPGGSGTVNICTQTILRTTQLTTHRKTQLTTNWEECGPCPVFANYTLAFELQLRKKHGKTSFRVEKNLSQVREKPQSG